MDTIHDVIRIGSYEKPELIFSEADDQLESVQILMGTDLISDTLPIGELSAGLYLDADPENDWKPVIFGQFLDETGAELLDSDGKDLIFQLFEHIAPGTPVWYDAGSRREKFYFKRIQRTGVDRLQLTAQDAVGLLQDAPEHMGGLYRGARMYEVVADILGGSALPVSGGYRISGGCAAATVSTKAAATRIWGHLPIQSRRDALHQLLAATGAVIRSDDDLDMLITFPASGTPVRQISDDSIYDGDAISESAPSGVEISVYSFAARADTPEEALFDNTDGSGLVERHTVRFSHAPVFGLRAEGLTVHESGVNYAIVSGTGVLWGRPHTESQRTISRGRSFGSVVQISGNKLINPLNAPYCLDRFYRYCTAGQILSTEFVSETERPGDLVELTDAYSETRRAWIQELRLDVTSLQKASATLISGYEPGSCGNAYDALDLLEGSGTYTVPNGVSELFVVLSGGGDGGCSGADGTPATTGVAENDPGDGGAGGAGGDAGAGGRLLSLTMSVTPGQQITYSCGSGGAGGTVSTDGSSGTGGAGTDTTFGGRSTAEAGAYRNAEGFAELMSGETLSAAGNAGIAGSKGGTAKGARIWEYDDDISIGSSRYTHGLSGVEVSVTIGSSDTLGGYGGAGGGAAAGANGSDGGNGKLSDRRNYGIGGAGGSGASASIPGADGAYGSGGSGGHGGGGGGTGSKGFGTHPGRLQLNHDPIAGGPGPGGRGSSGGRGGDGYVAVYRKGVSN